MKVLTAAEMREVDRRSIEAGIPDAILMENAGHRVVEYLIENYAPLNEQRVLIFCGKGNNGGDGLVVARQLHTRIQPDKLWVVCTDPDDTSDAMKMARAAGVAIGSATAPEMQTATLVVDALLGTGLSGAARGKALDFIREINEGFLLAAVVAVDIPSGMPSDGESPQGEVARADATVTFTAPKRSHVLGSNADTVGDLAVGQIGSPPSLYEHVTLHVTETSDFQELLQPRPPDSNKGRYGHVLVVGGAEGKLGASEMAGLAALRSGAGLVTVAASAKQLSIVELMSTSWPADDAGFEAAAKGKNVIAIGPGLGQSDEAKDLLHRVLQRHREMLVIDADGLNMLGHDDWKHAASFVVLTPHPGEMARLINRTVKDVQADRLECAQSYAAKYDAVVVLKGHRTLIAFPDGDTWINTTGSPAMSTGGTGDILTGMVAGLLAQFPDQRKQAVIAAVYLHGLCGELAGDELGEKPVIATDLLTYLPEALGECEDV